MRIRYSIISFFILFGGSVIGQDIHFSQFYMSPLNLNPAMTGVMNYDQRLILNYRNQWSPALGSRAYNTSSVSYDRKQTIAQYDYFGIGGSIWGDVAGDSNLATVQTRVSGSYSKYLNGNQQQSTYLVVGTDLGYTQRRISTDNLRWPLQHNGLGAWDPNAPSRESTLIDNNQIEPIQYLDLSVGLLLFRTSQIGSSYYGGVSFSHLNQPNVSFLGDVSSLYIKTTVHAGADIPVSPKVSILPNAIALIQGPHSEYNVGGNIRYQMNPRTALGQYVQFGLWLRTGNSINSLIHADAVILTARVDNGVYGIGISYDATVSNFRKAATGNGSFELSANYHIAGKQDQRVFCPKF